MKTMLALFTLIFLSEYGQAQFYVPSWEFTSNHLYLASSYTSIKNLEHATQALQSNPSQPAPKGPVAQLNGNCNIPKTLASNYPPDKQAEVEKLFRDLLANYRGIETQLQIPHGDMGGALALFLGTNYAAAHDVDVSDAHFMTLMKQMNILLNQTNAFSNLSEDSKQSLFENLVIVGMFTASIREGLKQKPDEQLKNQLKESATNYLQNFLKVNSNQISISDNGLEIK